MQRGEINSLYIDENEYCDRPFLVSALVTLKVIFTQSATVATLGHLTKIHNNIRKEENETVVFKSQIIQPCFLNGT